MATARNVMDALVTIVEGVSVDTVYDAVSTFTHDDLTFTAEDVADHQSPTRQFVLLLTGDRVPGGAHGASGSPIHVTQTFDLAVTYRCGESGSELFRVIAEDVDRIGTAMLRPALWDQSNTGISKIAAGPYGLDGLADSGGTALVTIPLSVHYKPSFTG